MEKEENINTVDYWEKRFRTGDWAEKGGFAQTRLFAAAQVPLLQIPPDFAGSICDFGCGAGDAFPVYRKAYPKARLAGVDFSASAIRLCQERYSGIAEFFEGGYSSLPECDVVIISNVLEHLDDDRLLVKECLEKCCRLFVVVPFLEQDLCVEHVRSYDIGDFSEFPVVRQIVFPSRGWSEFGLKERFFQINIKNIYRGLTGRPIRRRKMQILYEMAGSL